jgi:hypothetical protein
MAKVELKVLDVHFEHTKASVQAYEELNLIGVFIHQGKSFSQIRLDKSTAIKFAKMIRTEIGKIK